MILFWIDLIYQHLQKKKQVKFKILILSRARACLKRRHVYVAVWPRGRSAEIIEPLYISIINKNISNKFELLYIYY